MMKKKKVSSLPSLPLCEGLYSFLIYIDEDTKHFDFEGDGLGDEDESGDFTKESHNNVHMKKVEAEVRAAQELVGNRQVEVKVQTLLCNMRPGCQTNGTVLLGDEPGNSGSRNQRHRQVAKLSAFSAFQAFSFSYFPIGRPSGRP